MATHSIILAWKVSWTEEPGGFQSVGSVSEHTFLPAPHPEAEEIQDDCRYSCCQLVPFDCGLQGLGVTQCELQNIG